MNFKKPNFKNLTLEMKKMLVKRIDIEIRKNEEMRINTSAALDVRKFQKKIQVMDEEIKYVAYNEKKMYDFLKERNIELKKDKKQLLKLIEKHESV